jgi:pyridoxamine 5'-phosphate oxidase
MMEFMSMRSELVGDGPIDLFKRWLGEAEASELNDPNAAALATATQDGIPNVRMVLIKDVSNEGFSFFTNAQSQKGQEIAANPRVALCFHWKSLRRQVRVAGSLEPLPAESVDHYFHTRSRASQIGACVSQQSHVLPSREVLEAEVAAFNELHKDQEIPRPPVWRGYLLQPASIEFWMDGANRLHDRRLFQRSDSSWASVLLYP